MDEKYPDLDLEIDPKLAWALRHPECFPLDINKADYNFLLRVPGIGVKSAKLIVLSRRYARLKMADLKKMGIVLKKAQYFITCNELVVQNVSETSPEYVRKMLTEKKIPKGKDNRQQLSLFD